MGQRPIILLDGATWWCVTKYEIDGTNSATPIEKWDVTAEVDQIQKGSIAFVINQVGRNN